MPTQPTVSQKARILQKLAEKAANRKADNAQDGSAEESEVHFLRNLTHVFPLESRKTLASNVIASSGSDAPELSDLSKLAEDFLLRGGLVAERVPAKLLNRLGRQNHAHEPTEDGERTRMTIFKPVQSSTVKDYARRLASLLAFCFLIQEDSDARQACGIAVKTNALVAIQQFRDGFNANKEDTDKLMDLLLALSAGTYGHLDNYNVDVLCSFAIGQMFDDESGKFRSKENANKTVSAFKYSFRMAILCKLSSSPNADLALTERTQCERSGPNHPFKQLTILQAGLNSLPRKLKPQAMVLDEQCERVSVNGIPCSFDLLNDAFHSLMDEAKDKLEELLMGFVPEDLLENAAESLGYSSLPFTANFAFGQVSDSEYGDMSLFEYVYAHDEHKPHFFGRNRANAKRDESRDYLKSCMEYEKILIALMHILLGCGPRSTDYAFLTFMNGDVESEERTLSIYDSKYLICYLANNKGSKLHRKDKGFAALLPRTIANSVFVAYWKYVRPFALMLMDSLGNRQSFDRWKRYCFVQACDPKWVRKHVCDAFGGRTTGRNLKWLRHSLIFLMRQFVKGNSANSSLPVYKLFAHSESTDACYAIEKLAGFPPERCTNTTDMRLILNTLWQKINLEARRANPTDSVEDSEDDQENSDDDSAAATECDVASTSSDVSLAAASQNDETSDHQEEAEQHLEQVPSSAPPSNASLHSDSNSVQASFEGNTQSSADIETAIEEEEDVSVDEQLDVEDVSGDEQIDVDEDITSHRKLEALQDSRDSAKRADTKTVSSDSCTNPPQSQVTATRFQLAVPNAPKLPITPSIEDVCANTSSSTSAGE